MKINERRGWTEIVDANDLDNYMVAIGQAKTNALLVVKMLKDFPLNKCSTFLIPGCGTGQMFDFIKSEQIGDYQYTFTDLNKKFLNKLKKRLSTAHRGKYELIVDDIEKTRLRGQFNGIIAVLLLEHVNWKKAVDSFMKFKPLMIYLIIQKQKGEKIIRKRNLPASIKKFAGMAHPGIVSKQEIEEYMEKNGYKVIKTYERKVPDKKTMVGLVIRRKNIKLSEFMLSKP